MNTRNKLLFAALLFLLPFVIRWAWFNRPQSGYTPPAIPSLESLSVTLPETSFEPVTDSAKPGDGRVVADLTHGNNLLTDDLTPLSERLAARGVELEHLTDYSALESTLRGASALVVIAPTYSFDSTDRQIIEAFVKDGGKLLIIADPTRQVPIPEEDLFYNPYAVFFPESAVPVVNSLSSIFGLIYFDDYLYHLESQEGNYRNVRYTELNSGSALTQGADELVLFAAHSIRGGTPLFIGSEGVLSNKRTGESELAPAMISEDGQVVALGDLTLITAPYHTVAGNDQFLSNLADWLVEDSREWNLPDFPYLFDDVVEFVQLKEGDMDPRLLVFGSSLQDSLNTAGIQLIASENVSPTQDALLVGTILDYAAVEGILQSAGVTVTLTFSETEEDEPPTLADLREGKLEIAGFGTLDVSGTTLYVEAPVGAEEATVVVLAYDDASLSIALDNLIFGFSTGCLSHQSLTICSTGEVDAPPGDFGGSGEDFGTPPPSEEGSLPSSDAASIFIIAMDNGPDGILTSAFDLEFYLSSTYNVTVWSVFEQGLPTPEDAAGYDLFIIDSGDYAFDVESFEALDLGNVETPTWILGAQPIFAFETEALVDIEVADVTHPIVTGISETLITLSDSLSGVPEQLFRPEDFEGSDGTAMIILTRGPGNATPGGPVLFAVDDGSAPRSVILALPFYRLPFDIQEVLALNIVNWMLEGG